jgi:hypothetical protein
VFLWFLAAKGVLDVSKSANKMSQMLFLVEVNGEIPRNFRNLLLISRTFLSEQQNGYWTGPVVMNFSLWTHVRIVIWSGLK